MILEGEFLFGDTLRWNLGWPTPNYAGAFWVTLLVLGFGFSSSRWRWIVLIVEVSGLFLMAKTYSRGAVVAWCLAWLFGVAVSNGWKKSAHRPVWVARLCALTVVLLAVGFGWSRVTETKKAGETLAAVHDGSIVNRLALWKGGLQMIAAAPLTGWGAGESGRAYMNWYQDVDRMESYSTMVNSYLHIGVEHGLITLWAILCGFGWLIIASWSVSRAVSDIDDGRPGRSLQLGLITATSTALMAWAVANVFTTLWIEPGLWVVPLFAIGLLSYTVFRQRHLVTWRWLAGAAAMSSLAVVVLYSLGIWLDRSNSLQIQLDTSGTSNWVGLSKKSNRAVSPGADWNVWPDREVLGLYPGKELRRWVATQPGAIRLRVAPDFERETHPQIGRQFLFGQQATRLDTLNRVGIDRIYVVHPLAPPPVIRPQLPSKKTKALVIVLPEIDQQGNAPAWRKWAIEQGAAIRVTEGVGTDIRNVWSSTTENWDRDGNRALIP